MQFPVESFFSFFEDSPPVMTIAGSFEGSPTDGRGGRSSRRLHRFARTWGRSDRRRSSLQIEQLEPRMMLHGGMDPFEELLAEGETSAQAMPDFALVDVNATSSSYNQAVSPRDHLERVSGWYFSSFT